MGGHWQYEIRATLPDGTALAPINKRYTDISNLGLQLQEQEPAAIVPPVPVKDF